jgi:hypothetical protein
LETARLKSIQHPRRSKGLLTSFVSRDGVIPVGAHRVTLPQELTPALRRLADTGSGPEHVWIAFSHDHRIWFFTATPSLELSRERGRPVLEIRSYDEQGDLLESACWVHTRDEEWVRCA